MSVIVSLARLVTLPRDDLAGDASLRADFFARLTERLGVLARLVIGLSSLRHRFVVLPGRH
jgi:hypothetical protein